MDDDGLVSQLPALAAQSENVRWQSRLRKALPPVAEFKPEWERRWGVTMRGTGLQQDGRPQHVRVAGDGEPSRAARPVRAQDFSAAMGLSPAPPPTGPRTPQAAKRQRLHRQRW